MIPIPIQYEELERVYSATIGKGAKTVCLTAADRGEGVSTLAYALARRAAAAGKSTLLVDLNTARPSVAHRLGLDPVRNETDADGIVSFPSINLSVFCDVAGSSGLDGLRDAKRLNAVIATWSDRFDVVVFDTSPLTRVNQANVMADAVAMLSDATILVVLAGRTAETRVVEAVSRLENAGARLTGTVINDRYNPPLIDELCRETHRLDRWAPALMDTARMWLRRQAFLSQRL